MFLFVTVIIRCTADWIPAFQSVRECFSTGIEELFEIFAYQSMNNGKLVIPSFFVKKSSNLIDNRQKNKELSGYSRQNPG